MTTLEQTIRHHLVNFLAGKTSLDTLTEVVMGAVWDLGPDQNDAASDLAFAVQLALAELSDGLISMDRFCAQMRELVETISLTLIPEASLAPQAANTAYEVMISIGQRRPSLPRPRWTVRLQESHPQASLRELSMALA